MNMMNRFTPPRPQRPMSAAASPAVRLQSVNATPGQRLQQAAQASPQRPQPTTRPAPGAPARAVAPGANASRGEDMMAVIRQLSDVLTKENTALKRHKMDDVKVLGERKEQLARLYQQHMNAIHRDPETVKTWDPAKRNMLAQAAIRLSDLMKENASLLKANITAINTFLKTVVEAVKEKHEKHSAAYSKQGALNGYAAVKRNLAMSYNQTL